MRNALKLLAAVSLITLAACSQEEQAADAPSAEMAEAPTEHLAADAVERSAQSEAGGELSTFPERPAIPVTLPKIAYAFDYGFRLAGDAIAPLQQKHADLCEAKGPYVCQIVSLSQTGEDEDIRGELSMQVASDKARAFGFELAGAAAAADAEQVSATIAGEDLSKQIVDTEASLRSREALRDRLLEVLQTRRGKVSELVEAERNVAQVNTEIDQAKSWIAEMKGRVAYSRITVHYEASEAGSFLSPIRNAFGSLGAILGNVIAVLLMIGAVVVPLILAGLGVREVARRLRPRTDDIEA